MRTSQEGGGGGAGGTRGGELISLLLRCDGEASRKKATAAQDEAGRDDERGFGVLKARVGRCLG